MHAGLRAALLWDRLYPDLDDFAIALNASDPKAIGRFVEVDGLFATEKTLGKSVWKNFPSTTRGTAARTISICSRKTIRLKGTQCLR